MGLIHLRRLASPVSEPLSLSPRPRVSHEFPTETISSPTPNKLMIVPTKSVPQRARLADYALAFLLLVFFLLLLLLLSPSSFFLMAGRAKASLAPPAVAFHRP